MNLSEPREGYVLIGRIGAVLAFLLVGAGMQITQTAGLALATDVAPGRQAPPRGGFALRHVAVRPYLRQYFAQPKPG
jgi:hypothetical protein